MPVGRGQVGRSLPNVPAAAVSWRPTLPALESNTPHGRLGGSCCGLCVLVLGAAQPALHAGWLAHAAQYARMMP